MQENARQGYFNGARPTFGYRTVETEATGNKGPKKRMEIDPVKAELVRQVVDLCLDGQPSQPSTSTSGAAFEGRPAGAVSSADTLPGSITGMTSPAFPNERQGRLGHIPIAETSSLD